jgi:hypothetical protein
MHGKFKLTEIEKSETGEEQSLEHAHHFSLTPRKTKKTQKIVMSGQAVSSAYYCDVL